jgi:HEAT repeat protein
MVLALAAALGFLVWKNMLKPVPPPPPPPPPPPAILNEPAPVISDADLQKVLKSAEDTEPDVRWQAVMFLDKVKAPQAMPLFFNFLQHDQEPSVRIKVTDVLSTRHSPEVLQALLGATKDQEPTVRVAALKALDKIGDYSVASAIADGPIRDQDETVRLQAMKTLNSLQDRKQKEIDDARKRYEAEKQKAAQQANAPK